MQYFKLQLGCLLIVLYVAYIYAKGKSEYRVKNKPVFDRLLIIGTLEIILDGATAYSINHLSVIPSEINTILHLLFLCCIDTFMFLMFLYILDITRGIPQKSYKRLIIKLPLIINIVVVVIFIPKLTYKWGNVSYYSHGISAYTCFVMVAIYMLATVVSLIKNIRQLGQHRLITVATYVADSVLVTLYQLFHPQSLISCLVPTLVIVGTYLNMENPVFSKLEQYNNAMVMGFATLVEKRDDNTGGHIKRTTAYVRLLAHELRMRGIYTNQLTKTYINKLALAAPMHDVGKIAIPDAILQKPGKLTNEEFDIMKTHAEKGGQIIQDTFDNMGDDEYEEMAYEVARHHHEKWNGKGYPDGLSGKEIPLPARIMAVADVFDAVSAKRCYRDALPLEECFQIIENGIGTDFDPIIAETFLDMKEKIREVYKKNEL